MVYFSLVILKALLKIFGFSSVPRKTNSYVQVCDYTHC